MSAHPVIELIKKRQVTRSVPRNRDDSYKLGIVIDGGVMRSVVSSGMCYALQHLNYRNTFDAIYGSSGGAINGAYFKANQSLNNLRGYSHYTSYTVKNKYKRLLRGQRMMSRKDIFNKIILRGADRLYIDKVLKNDIALNIIATSVNCSQSQRLHRFSSRHDFIKALNASFNIPLIMGKPLLYGNDYYFDGGVLESIPYKQAIKDGCTHLLILCTFPISHIPTSISWFEKYVIRFYLRKYNPTLAERYMYFLLHYAQDIDYLIEQTRHPKETPYIYTVFQKSESIIVNRMEANKKKLIHGGRAGFQTIINLFKK